MKFNGFSKPNESVSSSDHIANKKNLAIYENRGYSRNAIVQNDMVKKSLNYTERYNMYKGFVHCKKLNPGNNENCFTIYNNSDVDPFTKVHLEDYHMSRVDYFDLGDNSLLNSQYFPFENDSHLTNFKKGTLSEKHTLFNPDNSKNEPVYMKNFKYGHSMSNLK
jgi:hypothetical protein